MMLRTLMISVRHQRMFNSSMQAIMAEAERQAQDYENALSRAHTTEEHMQQRLTQLDEQLQVRHPNLPGISLRQICSDMPGRLGCSLFSRNCYIMVWSMPLILLHKGILGAQSARKQRSLNT